MKRLLCFFTGLVFWTGQVMLAQSPNYRFRHLTVDNGLSHTDATSVLQDAKGFIWIGTYSGLNRHDGYTTKVYYNNLEGQRTAYLNRIADMQLSADNRLWLATEGGLALFDPATLSFKKIVADDATAKTINTPLQKILVAGTQLITVSQKGIQAYVINNDGSLGMSNGVVPSISGAVFNLKKDRQNNSWISHQGGIVFLSAKGVAKQLSFEDSKADTITALQFDESGGLHFSNAKGLFRMTQQQVLAFVNNSSSSLKYNSAAFQKLTVYANGMALPSNIAIDKAGNVWLSTIGGLRKYNRSDGKLEIFAYNEFERTSLSANSLNAVFIDRSDCLWMTSFGGGVNIADLNQKPFQLLQRVPNSPNTLSGNYTRALLEDEKGNLWIGTRNNGLNHYDFTTKTYTQFHPANSGLQSDNIRSLAKDNNGRIWIGTDVGISVRNADGSFDNLKPANGFSAGNYFSVAVDKFNQVWAGAWNNGLSRIRYKNKNEYSVERLTTASKNGLLSDRITFIYTDDQRHEVLVGTDHGLNHIFLNNDGSIASIRNYHAEGGTALSSEFVWPVLRQGDSLIWVGTLGGGLNKIRLSGSGQFTITQIKDNNAQALRDVESMLADDAGNLWLAGKLLAVYNPSKNEFIYYDVNDGLQGNSFKIGAAYKGKNGRLYFGGTNGVNYFNPAEIVSNTAKPSVAFTDLLINGGNAEKLDGEEALPQSISYLSDLRLSSSQNNFSVQFSAMHYANPVRCQFRYRLDGYDKDWVYTDASNRFARYSNLDYGDYILKVEAANNDGVWTGSERQLQISVLAPWWRTGTAKVIYLLLLIAIVYGIWHYQHSWFRLKRKLHLRELEEKKQEEIHQMKLQFFTNISHEFRTPLTLILGPTEKMLHNETAKEEQHNYLRLIYSNARRLLGLINELMDFRQAETDSLKLRVMNGDLSRFVKSIGDEFEQLASERNIVYNIKASDSTQLYFDPNITEKILVNLLSNAFKYTDNNGGVQVELFSSLEGFTPRHPHHVQIKAQGRPKDFVWIRVADTGIGITANSIANVFDRYFRVNTLGREKHLGSGVGLALVKSLVELHKGELRVYSERGEGTEFLVGLPAKKEAYSKLEILDDTEHQIDFENLQYTIDWISEDLNDEKQKAVSASENSSASSADRKRILIVEDNAEMRRFLAGSLHEEYEIIEAANGMEGLERAIELMPDLIISDLMMPEMDGTEFCKKVRENIAISHTPFVLITAKASVETHVEGAESGADLYFPKPFSLRLLQVTIRKLFEARARLKAKYNNDVFAETRELVNNQKDKEFLDELIAIIEENMEDEDMDVDKLCRKIGMSRTKLYGKVKGVTGQPIGEFIRLLRLKKAAKILVSEDVPVVEAMYRVGIQSQSYFTKAFKKEFGKTPSQFVAECSKRQSSGVKRETEE